MVKMSKPMNFSRSSLLCALLLAGCAEQALVPPKLELPPRPVIETPAEAAAKSATAGGIAVSGNPSVPVPPAKAPPPAAATPAATQPGDMVSLNFESLPLPAFIQTVYALSLKRTINLDPAVEARKDLVNLHSGKPLTPAEADSSARLVLKSYGIAVIDAGGLVRFVPDNNNLGYLPEIRRGNAQPDTPLPLRPVFQLLELQAVRNTDVSGYIRTLFNDKIRMTEDPGRNAIVLAGNGDDVQAAIEAVRLLDQPLFKGRDSIRITPLVWSADDLAKRLTEILTQEGYSVGTATPGALQYPITLLPVAGINSVIVFAQNKEIVKHIVDWAAVLDKPVEKSVGRNIFTYAVKNTDATRLMETIQPLLGGARSAAAVPAPSGAVNTGTTATSGGNVFVDKGTNSLLFRASSEEYSDVIRVLHELDRPARQVLIEVTVAEVDAGDTSNTGVDWIFSRLNKSGMNVTSLTGNTQGASQVGGGIASSGSGSSSDGSASSAVAGFVVSQLDGSGNPRLVLNALATNNHATVLSSPRLIARSGESADFSVGSEVPVLTSQQSSGTSGLPVVTNSVQYRNTGVILKIKPVVHSSDSVDLEVNQEVSSVNSKQTGVGSSPVFSKNSLNTKLTLRHGSTYILGGLISSDSTKTNSGVPFLKDLPLVGRAFGSNADTANRQQLIVLITPYIMSDDNDARAVTEAFRKQLGPWAEEQKPSASAR